MSVVFVYGTLTDHPHVSRLLKEFSFGPPARCWGFKRVDGRYPTVVPGERVAGRLLETPEIGRLDDYEGVDRELYHRYSIPLINRCPGTIPSVFDVDTAEIYIGDPLTLGVSQPADWSASGSFTQCVTEYIETHNVHVNIKGSER